MTFRKPSATSGKKIPAPPTPAQDNDKLPPAFCLRLLVPDYCLTRCNDEQKIAFADTLYQLSRRSWIEIRGSGRHGAGTEKIDRASIKAAIPPSVTPDVVLLAFRFWKKAPMVGFRDGRIFHIVWLDRDFSLYDHG